MNQLDVASLTFFPHLDVLLASHIFPPGLLDGPGVAVKLALPCLFQQKELSRQTREPAQHTVSKSQTIKPKDRHTSAQRMEGMNAIT